MRKWLKDLRDAKGFTQQQVSELCDISRSYYTHIENGTKTPTVDVAKKIAEILNFNWTIFFESQCPLKEQINTA